MKGKTLEAWERWFRDFNRCSTGMQKHLKKRRQKERRRKTIREKKKCDIQGNLISDGNQMSQSTG
jgi:hypothetical protein